MTAMIETDETARRQAFPTVAVAGVAWPTYKIRAVLAAVVAAVASLAMAGSLEITAWVGAVVLLVTWWGGRYRAGKAATDPASNPAGIS